MFGANKPGGLFGTSTPTPNAFGQPSTSFGATTSTFGVVQPQQQSLFGAPASTGGFGTSGTSLFGQPNQQTSIFGSTPGQSSAFGQQAATSTFGRPAVGAGMFGSSQTQPAGFGASTFGSSPNTFGATSGAFGSTQAPNGTTIKFVPVSGTDTMMKNGVNSQINTRHQCITAMKEYESKSLEELRLEDYLANRKGPQGGFGGLGQSQSGSSLFGTPSLGTSGGFGSNLFNNQAKPAFGTSLAPTATTPSLFGSSFGQNKPAFGSSVFGATQNMNPVQPTQQPSLFGAPAQQGQGSVFGQTSTFPSFGAGVSQNSAKPLFGPSLTSTPGFGGTNLGNSFNPGSAGKPLFGTSMAQPGFGTGGLGTTTFPSFSSPATSTTQSMFSSQPQQQSSLFPAVSKPFSFNSTPSFGTTTQPTLQLNLGSSLFNTPTAFGTGSMFGPSAGQQSSSLFSQPGQNVGSGFSHQGAATQASTSDLLLNRLHSLPYGSSSLFKDDLNSLPPACTKFTTDPKTLNLYQNQYRLNSRPQTVVERTPSVPVQSSLLFDDVEEKEERRLSAQDIFCPRKNIKKLVLKPRNEAGTSQLVSSSLSTDAGESSDLIDTTVCEFVPRRSNTGGEKDDSVPGLNFSLRRSNTGGEKDDSVPGLNFSLDTLGDDSLQSIPSRSLLPNLKCGLVSSRPDYYTIPLLDAIDACYSEETGTCVLDNFTVGRKNYGSIYWEGPLDVTGINLDEVVHIRRKEVIVYPDDEEKPPVGKGLNRPAQITLDQVWPVDKTTNEVIRDVETIVKMNYPAKIENATIKLRATFRDYRPDTGSWVFCVKHFSKYGLTEDDEDEPMAVGGGAIRPPTGEETGRGAKELVIPATAQRGKELFSATAQRGKELFPVTCQREVPEKTVIHKISAFSPASEHRFLDFPSDDFPFTSGFDKFQERFQPPTDYFGGLRSVLFSGEEEDDMSNLSQKQKKQKVVEFESTPSPSSLKCKKKKLLPIISTHQKRELGWIFEPFPSSHKVFLDICSVKSAPCSRVSFFRGSSHFLTVSGKSIIFSKIDQIPELSRFDDRMESQLVENTRIRTPDRTFVRTSVRTHPQVMAFAETMKKCCNSKNAEELNQLVFSVFGDLKTRTLYEQQEERMNRVIEWLAIRNRRHRLPSDPIDRVLYHLCINDVQGAVEEALKGKNPRLASLLSTGTCSSSKEYTLFQLDSWKTSQGDRFIKRNVMKLFVLIAGIGSWTLSGGEQVSPFEGLSWSQQLILMLLYNLNADLKESVAVLKESVAVLKESVASLETDSPDVEFHLLSQLDGDQWITLAHSSDDLESWFLHQSLLSYNVIQNDVRSDCLHARLVSHLLSKSLRWAIFVALHVMDDELRSKLVSGIVSKEGSSLTEAETVWLVDRLSIPSSEFSSAKATYHKASFQHLDSAIACLDSAQFVSAYDLLVERIFPELVINEQFDILSNLVSRLKQSNNSIPNWFTSGGHLYDVYVTARLGSGDGVLPLLQLSPVNINLMKCPTNRHVLAQSQIALVFNELTKSSNNELLIQLRSNCAPIIQHLVL